MMVMLLKIWGGLIVIGIMLVVIEVMMVNLLNVLFVIDDLNGFNQLMSIVMCDIVYCFYQDQMQINGGKNDMYVVWIDVGGLMMGYYMVDLLKLLLWKIVQQYVFVDNFFMGVFGGLFLNYQYLICVCVLYYLNVDKSLVVGKIVVLNVDGKLLKVVMNLLVFVLSGLLKFVNDGVLMLDFYGINMMQLVYQLSGNKVVVGGDLLLVDLVNLLMMLLQMVINIGDLMINVGVLWVWYGGVWGQVLQVSQNGMLNVIYGVDLLMLNFQLYY